MNEADQIRTWLQKALAESGMSVQELARASGVHKSTIFRALSADYPFVPSNRTIAKLAEAAQAARDLPILQMPPYEVAPLHIPYELSPSYWLEEAEPSQQISGNSQIAPHPSVPLSEQWVGRMRGDSMAPVYEDGDDLHIANLASLMMSPRQGDHVILKRRREATGGFQFSARMVLESAEGAVLLGFASQDRRWIAEIQLPGLFGEIDGVTNEIVGMVIGMYRTRPFWR